MGKAADTWTMMAIVNKDGATGEEYSAVGGKWCLRMGTETKEEHSRSGSQ